MALTPTSKMRRLARSKLDKSGEALRKSLPALRATPRGGWIAAIREALGMSQSDLARRLGVVQSSVVKLEKSERSGTVRVETLRRAADALDCELVVLMVPRTPLQETVDRQRLKVYGATIHRAAVHMELEDQAVSSDLRQHLLQQAEDEIPDSALWGDRV